MIERNGWRGFFLVPRSEFTSQHVSGSGVAYMGYDTARKAYAYDEFNSTGEAQHARGALKDNLWTWTGEQRLDGKSTYTRLQTKILSPDVFEFTLETSPAAPRGTSL